MEAKNIYCPVTQGYKGIWFETKANIGHWPYINQDMYTIFKNLFFCKGKVIYGLIETLPYQTGMIRMYNVKFVLTLTYVLSTTGHCLRYHYQTWKAINKRRKHLGWGLIVICCLKCITPRGYHPSSSRRFVTDMVF